MFGLKYKESNRGFINGEKNPLVDSLEVLFVTARDLACGSLKELLENIAMSLFKSNSLRREVGSLKLQAVLSQPPREFFCNKDNKNLSFARKRNDLKFLINLSRLFCRFAFCNDKVDSLELFIVFVLNLNKNLFARFVYVLCKYG
ncbi:hypothetical protein [Helicobacter burdigaliensis]|uniref:hypothetical protein n=1 Tax=Helicobacter burdigaliensis TaxID=2315334 RepID=UPI000EF6782B|nr:hypothetical protein [Helicobacter burdigaliensis]